MESISPKTMLRITFVVVVALLIGSLPNEVIAQPHIISTVSKHNDGNAQPPSRDFWFCIPANRPDVTSNKYIALYMTATSNGEVTIQAGTNQVVKLPLSRQLVTTYMIPKSMEITSSGVLENKAIHVFSSDADITLYWMSHDSLGEDGSQIMPASTWGTDYVVAAYSSNWGGVNSPDLPSEFTIVANRDNTVVEITPPQDIRVNGQPNLALHLGHRMFTEVLSKGQTVQYQAVGAQNSDDFDLTGTIVHSNFPIGVTGASMSANIPADFPDDDFVAEIMPPVSSWGKTYLSIPFITRKGGDTFLVIGSCDNQLIWTTDAITGKKIYCTLNKYTTYFRPDIESATKWESDSAFLLVQYINSATWPDHTIGDGAPAEVVINSVERFTKTLEFQVPIRIGSDLPVTTYVHIICRKGSEHSTTLDGVGILGGTAKRVASPDPNYSLFIAGPIKTGAHLLVSDSGIGCYVYGYGNDQSFAWGSPMNLFPINTPDTVAPLVTVTTSACRMANLTARDSGAWQTGVKYVNADTLFNMVFMDLGSSTPGSSTPSHSFEVHVIDSAKHAYAGISTFDASGNVTKIILDFQPKLLQFDTDRVIFVGTAQDTTIDMIATVKNSGSVPFPFTLASLRSALSGGTGHGISILSMDTSVLPPGAIRTITLRFKGDATKYIADTLILGSECSQFELPLRTNFIADFFATDVQFGTVSMQPTATRISTLSNTGTASITIDSIWTGTDFYLDPSYTPNTLPIFLPAQTSSPVQFVFSPSTTGVENALAYFRSKEAGVRTCRLTGTGLAVGGVLDKIEQTNFSVTAYPNPLSLSETRALTLQYSGNTGGVPTLTLYNALGAEVKLPRSNANQSNDRISIELPELVPGVYYYRIENGKQTQTGRLVLIP